MTYSDIPACLMVIAECWDKSTAQIAKPDLESMFASTVWKPFFYVAEENNEIIGLACYNISWLCYGIYDFTWHGVKEKYRNKGVGRSLVQKRLDDLKSIADYVMIVTGIPEYYEKHFDFKTISKMETVRNYGEHLMLLKI